MTKKGVTVNMEDYLHIKNQNDVNLFYNTSNGLHDGYITSVEYSDYGIEALDGCTKVYTDKKLLKIRVLITSLEEKPTAELVFQGVTEWQFRAGTDELFGCTIDFKENETLIWADSFSTEPDLLKRCTYVKASTMCWKFV